MSQSASPRIRWRRYCLVIAASASIVAYYSRSPWGASQRVDSRAASQQQRDDIDLAPTLANARELPSLSSKPLQGNATWNPEPNWNSAMLASPTEFLPRTPFEAPAISPIPEEYPLPPRARKEPPTIGNALDGPSWPTDSAIAKESHMLPPISPFAIKSMPMAIDSGLVALGRPPSSASSAASQAGGWPDQTFTPGQVDAVAGGLPVDLTSPHLLTGSIVRPVPLPAAPADSPTTRSSHGFSVLPNQPPTSRYILQPIRKP